MQNAAILSILAVNVNNAHFKASCQTGYYVSLSKRNY